MDIFINEYEEGQLIFHLQNEEISYILGTLPNGHIGSYYFGKKLRQDQDLRHLQQMSPHPLGSCPNPESSVPSFSLDMARCELPTSGTGDYRSPALVISQANGSRIVHFQYQDYSISNGKADLPGLPHAYVSEEQEASTLIIRLRDELLQSELEMRYTIFCNLPVVTRSVSLSNHSDQAYFIEKLCSASLDFISEQEGYSFFHFSGAWAREMQLVEKPIHHGQYVIGSTRGVSSANHQPFIGIKKGQVNEHSGECYGMSLVYSGHHQCLVEKDHYGVVRAQLGIHPEGFRWQLESGGTYYSPEAVLTYSDQGLAQLSHTYHDLVRRYITRGRWKDQPRPIIVNNWEATYFDFDEERILSIAKKGQELGAELFVLDDGWFGARDHDAAGLGDWEANLKKLPQGLTGLAQKVRSLGLDFGIWLEPEMVNKDSDLYRAHPDWILAVPHRYHTPSRNQHTLDVSRSEVRQYIVDAVSKILDDPNITYVKWDMNRPMTEVMSSAYAADQQGEVAHRYVLGLYEILERLTTKYPEVLFESCASGGNRCDLGMMYYMPQCWISDNTDSVDRVKIQYGASHLYPLSSMGAHVSAVPNHQTGRITKLSHRAHVAYFGVFGYELDLDVLTNQEQAMVARQIAFFKKHRALFQFGRFYRLGSPYTSESSGWICVSPDQRTAIAVHFRRLATANDGFERLVLSGLAKEVRYRLTSDTHVVQDLAYGDSLMSMGIFFGDSFFGTSALPDHAGDFRSKLILLEAVD